MQIQVGKPHVSVHTLPPQTRQLDNLWHDHGGVFLQPGEGAVLKIDCPFVIATAGWYLVVAYAADEHNVIDIITKTFLVRDMPIDEITMCMLFANPAVVPKFVEHACQIGLQNFWTMYPLSTHQNLARAHSGLNHVLVRRDN